MPRRTGAQLAIDMLRAHGVGTVFGIPGVHTLPLYDALYEQQQIRHVLGRHEQGVGFMADGYARATGRVGVACVITGPGVTNVSTPMADAYADSVPVLVIGTSLPRAAALRPTGDLHELKDQLGVMTALAGWVRAVDQVEEIPDAIRDAFRALRSGRPRGAFLQIPLDLLAASADVPLQDPAPVRLPEPEPDAIAATAILLRNAQRPLIVAGAGVTLAGANDLLAALSTKLQAPVLLGGKSRDVLPDDHPLVVPVSGYGLSSAVIDLVSQADAVLVVGSKLGDMRTGNRRLPLPSALAQIDLDPAEIGRRYPVAVGVTADARQALDALLAALDDVDADRRSRVDEIARVRTSVRERAQRTFGAALAYLDAVRAVLPREGIVVADMTMLGYASADYLPVYEPRTYIHPAELCTIGCGLPLAMGAKVGRPDLPVVALCGDGGFLLNTGELASAVQEQIAVTVVLFNDRTYTAVKDAQRRGFAGRYIATDLTPPDYVALANAFGATGVRVEDPEGLRAALRIAIAAPGPTLIEVPLPPMI